MPTCTIKLFAQARDSIGKSQIPFTFDQGETLGDLRSEIVRLHPEIESIIRHCSFAIDQEYATDETQLNEGCEVACIPPVSGG